MCVFEMRKCYVAEVISRTFAADQTHTVEQAPSPRLPGEFGCLNIRVKQHLQDIGQFDPDETESPPLPRDHDGALAWLQLHVDVVVEPVPSSTVFDIDLNVDLPFSLAKAGDLVIADPSRGDDPRCRLLAVVRVRPTAELAVYHEELDGDASFDLLALDFAVNGAVFGMVTDL
ncbi:hypothetical protein Poli38472_008071 [Pythium oligandrum]|uniref:Uncharacterized protein n=1 Tax=Pythium oligandrum TaxID=41045 RepID=A0A8K1FLN4_PYTOL|nr:hypothetical protein Poli38472_008071 [Pythium oligandrum]|eukprot:TMW65429.1 hypothetical protein Poli38472_008071 [Pythium oligandrum]